jgi:PAS domain-containing protein
VEAETSAFLGSGATSYSHSFRIVRPDGAVRVILDRGTIERDASGAVRVIRGLNIDLTDFPHLDQASIEDRRLENAREVAGRQEAEQRLLERNRQLDLLSRTSQRLLLDAGPEQELLRAILADIAEQIGADSFYHYRPFEPALLGLEIAAGVGEEELKSVAVVKYGELLCGRVAETGTALIVEDLQNVSEPGADGLKAWGAASYAGFPVIAGGKLIGTLAFVSQTRTHFRDDEIRTIQSICNQIAITLERRRLQRELRVSERRFKLALAGSPITLFEHDLELRYQWLFNAKLGYSDSFAIGKTDRRLRPGNPRSRSCLSTARSIRPAYG